VNQALLPTRRDRLLQIAYLLAAHERATPLARRVLECRLCLVESELNSALEDEVAPPEEDLEREDQEPAAHASSLGG
jgi:hypothetical protein